MEENKFRTEELHVKGDEILSKVKDLIHQGNVRRIIIKNKDGKKVIEIPLLIGIVSALWLPQLAAIGVIATLLSRATIVVEKIVEE